jgi:hypothetical protein
MRLSFAGKGSVFESEKAGFLHYGETMPPDTGMMVLPWVILDW